MLLNLEQAVEVIIGKGRFLFIRFYNFRNTHKRAIEIGSNQSIVVGKPVSHCVQDSCNGRSIRIGRQLADARRRDFLYSLIRLSFYLATG